MKGGRPLQSAAKLGPAAGCNGSTVHAIIWNLYTHIKYHIQSRGRYVCIYIYIYVHILYVYVYIYMYV